METTLITGAAGFIGSNLAEKLLAEGQRVVGVDNFDHTYDIRFKKEHIAEISKHPHFTLVEMDVANREAVSELFAREKPERIAHLAAKADTRAAVMDPYPYVDTNIIGTLNILEAAKQTPIKTIVLASSSSVYGNSTQVPWKEEAAAHSPLSPYGATKRAIELLAYAYHHNFGMPITCLRYFNVYGEHNRPNMVPYIWTQALLRGEEIELSGGGSRKRDYTYVGDTVRATITALKEPLGYSVLNIGNNHPLSLLELLSVLEEATGVKACIKQRESHKASVEETYADITKAYEMLHWKPEISIQEGMSRLVSWFKKSRLQ